jgi:hypothetical protein
VSIGTGVVFMGGSSPPTHMGIGNGGAGNLLRVATRDSHRDLGNFYLIAIRERRRSPRRGGPRAVRLRGTAGKARLAPSASATSQDCCRSSFLIGARGRNGRATLRTRATRDRPLRVSNISTKCY